MVTRMSPPSSPTWDCGARPQPRSSKMPAADTRAAAGTASWLTIPASTLMHSSVCPRASDRKSGGIFFRGKCLRGGPTPSCWRRHQTRIRDLRADIHANNVAQRARTPLHDFAATAGLVLLVLPAQAGERSRFYAPGQSQRRHGCALRHRQHPLLRFRRPQRRHVHDDRQHHDVLRLARPSYRSRDGTGWKEIKTKWNHGLRRTNRRPNFF